MSMFAGRVVFAAIHGRRLVPRTAASCATTLLPGFAASASLAPALLALRDMPGQIWWFSTAPIAPQDGSVTYLRNLKNGAQLYLVGTAHVSAKSAEEVRQVINQVRPDSIAVELCPERAKRLQTESKEGTKNKSIIHNLVDSFRSPGGLGPKIIGFLMKSMYELLRNTGVEPGKEFKVAMEESERLGTKLHLVDQDVHVTLKKLWEALSWQDLYRLLTTKTSVDVEVPPGVFHMKKGEFEDAIEMMKTRQAARQLTKAMEALAPNVVKVMVHERDRIMTEHLRECEGVVVGVVGMAHMDGIERLWREADK